jgi:hypothetical protein
MAVRADVDGEVLARGPQVMLGAAVAAADECLVVTGVDHGVHQRPLSTGRHVTASGNWITKRGGFAFPDRPGSLDRQAALQ